MWGVSVAFRRARGSEWGDAAARAPALVCACVRTRGAPRAQSGREPKQRGGGGRAGPRKRTQVLVVVRVTDEEREAGTVEERHDAEE